MTGEHDLVEFPCMKETWQVVEGLLGNLKNLSQSPHCELKELAKEHETIVNISNGYGDLMDVRWGECTLYGLVKYLKKQASREERRVFLQSTFPAIIDLALDHPNVIPEDGLRYSRQQQASTTFLSRRCVASILACGFLCLFDERGKPWKRHQLTNVINFTNFFKNLQMASQFAKLHCILNYFEQVGARGENLEGNVTYIRQVISREEMPTMDSWLNCDQRLCPMMVHEEGVIEDAGCEAVEVDFANKFIGGGVLGRGRVQEEIRFTVCPELMGSMLFMEYMEDNEAIIIKGFEQFSTTQGYSGSLQYVGPHADPVRRDENGDFMSTLCAIDAVSYRNNSQCQYSDSMFVRDLNKAYVGFSARCLRGLTPPRETGMHFDQDTSSEDKGSSPTDEEYLTATDEEEDGTNHNPYLKAVSNLAEGLLVDIMSSALIEASTLLKDRNGGNQPSRQIRIDTCAVKFEETSVRSDEDEPVEGRDNLDVDLSDWVARFRRRSSNLSDVGSRRSSTASTRHSSEFSSEFEEFYENFQKREQPVIHKTIKEEAVLDINTFAVNLAAKLLQEGTSLAAHKMPVIQNFHSVAPDANMAKPKARKSSQEDTDMDSNGNDTPSSSSPRPHSSSQTELQHAENTECDITENTECDITEKTARKFADNLIRILFPFPDNTSTQNSNEQNCDEKADTKTSGDVNNVGVDSVSESIAIPESGSCTNNVFHSSNEEHSEEKSVRIKRSEDVKSKDSKKLSRPLTKEMKMLATDFVHEVVIGAVQKYSEEIDTEISIQDIIDHDTFADSDSDDPDVIDRDSVSDMCSSHVDVAPVPQIVKSGKKDKKYVFDFSPFKENPVNLNTQEKVLDSSNSVFSLGASASNQKQYVWESEIDDRSIPQVMITDESSQRENVNEDIYLNIAEKIVQDQVTSALLGMASHSRESLSSDTAMRHKQKDSLPRKGKLKPKIKPSDNELEPPQTKYRGQSSNNSGSCLSYSREAQREWHGEEKEPRKVTFFASSLSRDLLTNAFVEVQRNMNGGNVFRRSSEPLKISNHAAKCLIENSSIGTNGKGEKYMSLTVEDIGRFTQELNRWGSLEEFRAQLRRGSCGFRDPTLSRFAEQLMKSDCKIPDFHLIESTNWSTSGDSSVSFVSSVSAFKDPVLAGFEEELLSASYTKVNKSPRYTKYVQKKIPKLVQQKSLAKEKDNGLVEPIDNACVLKGALGKSFDSDASAFSWGSFQSSPSQSVDEYSSFADRLAERIVQESLQTLFNIQPKPNTCQVDIEYEYPMLDQDEAVLHEFANNLANDILLQSLVNLAKNYATYQRDKKRLSDAMTCTSTTSDSVSEGDSTSRTSTDAISMTSIQRSVSDDYTDAIDIPFRQLEMYAEELANRVLQHSVNVYHREQDSCKRRKYGRPLSTGNWGCGAFRGDPHLKCMLQWMAASYAGVPYMLFYTFQHPDLDELQEVVDCVTRRGWTVGQLMEAVRRYCVTLREMDESEFNKPPNFFQLLLSNDAFTDID